MVLALPKASRMVLASRICCWTQVEMLAVTLQRVGDKFGLQLAAVSPASSAEA